MCLRTTSSSDSINDSINSKTTNFMLSYEANEYTGQERKAEREDVPLIG